MCKKLHGSRRWEPAVVLLIPELPGARQEERAGACQTLVESPESWEWAMRSGAQDRHRPDVGHCTEAAVGGGTNEPLGVARLLSKCCCGSARGAFKSGAPSLRGSLSEAPRRVLQGCRFLLKPLGETSSDCGTRRPAAASSQHAAGVRSVPPSPFQHALRLVVAASSIH